MKNIHRSGEIRDTPKDVKNPFRAVARDSSGTITHVIPVPSPEAGYEALGKLFADCERAERKTNDEGTS